MVERLKVLVLKPNPFEFMLGLLLTRIDSTSSVLNLLICTSKKILLKYEQLYGAALKSSALKSRDIILLTLKVRIVKAVVFPVVIYGCEICTVKKAEHQRIDAFKLWCWRRFLRVPWTVRRANQSILSEINPEYLLEGLMLKPQYFGHLMQTENSLEKSLMLGKIEGRRRRWHQRMR